jgi:hypothetical protein
MCVCQRTSLDLLGLSPVEGAGVSIVYTILSADNCKLAKEFALNDAGKVTSKAVANMASGQSQRRVLDSLVHLPQHLDALTPNQALCMGVNRHGDTALTTKDRRELAGGVARCKLDFDWVAGPALFVIDVDVDGLDFPSVDYVMDQLESASPWLKDIVRIARPSSSSYVADRGLRGVHVYIAVTDGKHSEKLAERLINEQWRKGFGWVKISTSGALLLRQLSDASVYQPSRLIFEAAPILAPGITRNVPDVANGGLRSPGSREGRSVMYARDGLLIVDQLPEIKPLQANQVLALQNTAKQKEQARANEIALKWLFEDFKKQGMDDTQAKLAADGAMRARRRGIIPLDTMLRIDTQSIVSVRTILDYWSDAAGWTCALPDDTYREDFEDRHLTKALLTTRNGHRGLWSHKEQRFYVFQEMESAAVLSPWLAAVAHCEGTIVWPEQSRKGTPLLNVIHAIKLLNVHANRPLNFDKATYAMELPDDSERVQILSALSELGCTNLALDTVETALCAIAKENSVDSWKSIIDQLPVWDGIARLDTLFHDLMGADASPMMTLAAQALFASIYKRQVQPGAPQGVVPVLIGAQGAGKSQFAQCLARYFGRPAPTVSFRDAEDMCRTAQGSPVAELGEMAGHSKKDVAEIKDWITNTLDRYREKYGKQDVDHPRRFTLIGTANTNTFNNDHTGNRRFVEIRVRRNFVSDLKSLPVDQLLAEARDRFCLDEELYGILMGDCAAEAYKINAEAYEKGHGRVLDDAEIYLPEAVKAVWWNNQRDSTFIRFPLLKEKLKAMNGGVAISRYEISRWLDRMGFESDKVGSDAVRIIPEQLLFEWVKEKEAHDQMKKIMDTDPKTLPNPLSKAT